MNRIWMVTRTFVIGMVSVLMLAETVMGQCSWIELASAYGDGEKEGYIGGIILMIVVYIVVGVVYMARKKLKSRKKT